MIIMMMMRTMMQMIMIMTMVMILCHPYHIKIPYKDYDNDKQ